MWEIIMMPFRVAIPNTVINPIIDATESTPPERNTPTTPSRLYGDSPKYNEHFRKQLAEAKEILVNVSIDFQDNLSAGQVEEVVAELDKAIRIGFPTVTRIFIEARDLPNPAGKTVLTP